MSKISTKDVIRISAYLTDKEGYIKRSDNPNVECTADKVIDAIELNSIADSDLEDVKDRVSGWFNYINDIDHQTGEYFDNLRIEACKPTIDEMKIGLIASSFASYDRYRSYKVKNDADKSSNFLGEEGDKVTFTIAEYKLVKSGTSKFNSGSSKYYLYRIKDDSGNIIVWFADHDCEFEFSHSNKATATISKLNIFNEVKQTNVSKLKFM
jgi:hypothetical protein